MIPNRKDLPTDVAGCTKLIQGGRISLAEFEKYVGVKPFEGLLPKAFEAEIRADKTATVPMVIPSGAKAPDAAAFLWGDKPNPKVWNTGFSQLEIDPVIQVVRDAMDEVAAPKPPKPPKPKKTTGQAPAQAPTLVDAHGNPLAPSGK
jgi:hypothetical protein